RPRTARRRPALARSSIGLFQRGTDSGAGPVPPTAERGRRGVSIRIDITDAGDPRLGDFRDLKRADRRPDRPGGRGLVIAEGTVVVRRMIASAYPLRALLGVARRYDELRGDLADCPVPFYVADAE